MIQPRVRLALTASDYVVQPFEQDDLVALEPSVDAHTALSTYRTLRQFALPLFESLTRRNWPPRAGTHKWARSTCGGFSSCWPGTN